MSGPWLWSTGKWREWSKAFCRRHGHYFNFKGICETCGVDSRGGNTT